LFSYTEALEESTIECNASTEITIREDMDEAVVVVVTTTPADEVDTTATIQEDVVEEEDIMEDDTGMVVSTGSEAN
jgi:uncharacterized surface anchored protein